MTDNFVKVAQAKEIPQNSVRVVETAGRRLALCNVDGEFYAVADLCSHDNGPLGEGELYEGQIECPRHGARFDLKTGKPLCLPAVVPIPTYAVEVRGNEIWVDTSPKQVGANSKTSG